MRRPLAIGGQVDHLRLHVALSASWTPHSDLET
jgi:hypothetical protein